MGLFKKSPPDSSEYIIKEAIHNTKDRHPPSNQSWWQHKRTRFVIIGALTIIVIALAVIVPLIIVHQIQQVHNNSVHPESSPNPDPENIQDNSTTTEPPPPPPPVNPFDDSAQANNHVPPLNQSFPYTRTPIRGINLGGWLVLEPFITPSLFEQAPDPTKKPQERHETKDHVALDEWTLCQRLGPTRSRELLEHHLSVASNGRGSMV